MDRVEMAIEGIIASVPTDKKGDRAEVARQARMLAKITCRELGGALGLTIGQIADIEHGRLAVDDDVITAIVMVCGSKIVIDYFFGKREPLVQTFNTITPDSGFDDPADEGL